VSALAIVLAFAAGVSAQSRGNLRITGKVLDEAGKPVAEAEVRAAKKGEAKPETIFAKTNDKGEYTLKGLAAGEWLIEAAKGGLVSEAALTLTDADRNKSVDITLAPKPDPNAVLQAEHQRGLQLAQAGKIPEARKVYDDLLVKHPNVYQFHAMLAGLYLEEKNHAKALEHLNIALEKEPGNVEWQILKAEMMMETGDKEGARQLLDTIDLTKVKEPRAFVNAAINQINAGKATEAIELLTKLQAQFPNDASILYYRGKAYVAATKLEEAKADLEKFVATAPPGTPQLEDAKKVLAQLNKK
jgi:predicted Zn-dependent protease